MHRLLDEEEALEELDELDQDGDEKIQWKEFVESHFSYTEDEVKEMREKRSAEHEELLMVRETGDSPILAFSDVEVAFPYFDICH